MVTAKVGFGAGHCFSCFTLHASRFWFGKEGKINY